MTGRSVKNMAPRTAVQFAQIRKESRQRILDAALKVFARRGYYSASVSDIAKAAGVSKGLMYNYFTGKEEVLRELILGVLEKMMEQYMYVKPGEPITKKDVKKFIHDGIDIVLQNPHYWKLYFSVLMQPDVLALLMDAFMEKAGPYMASMTAYFRSRGDSHPEVMMRYFSAVMDGIQMNCVLDPDRFPAREMKEILTKQFAS